MLAKDVTFDKGSWYTARQVPRVEDSRAVMWGKQYELLNELNPSWGKRCVRETADELRGWGKDEDVKLLPDIPGREG